MALIRAYAQGNEAFRLGATKKGYGFWSDGAHDLPMMTLHLSSEGNPESGKVTIYGSEVQVR